MMMYNIWRNKCLWCKCSDVILPPSKMSRKKAE